MLCHKVEHTNNVLAAVGSVIIRLPYSVKGGPYSVEGGPYMIRNAR